MFELATRMKFRWNFKGQLSVEDLWDLSPTELNTLYRQLSASLKDTEDDSLIASPNAADVITAQKRDIVKHIFMTKKADAEAREAAIKSRQNRERIAEIIAKKKGEALESLSVEELEKMLEG